MKKIKTIFKTIFLATVVFVMAQSCIPTEPVGGNPTPTLTGKIKNIIVKSFLEITSTSTFFRINYEVKFNYDSLARVSSIDILDSTGVPTVPQISVTRSTNKVIVKQNDGAGLFVEDVFFLHANTNYIDSIYRLENSNLNRRTLIVRNNLNNIVRTDEIQYYFNVPYDTLTLDSFVYVNNNIVSLNKNKFGPDVLRKEFQYNTTLIAKVNTNTVGLDIAQFPTLFLNSWYPSHIDIEVLGISVGNVGKNLISGFREIYDDPNVPFFIIPTPDVYTATQIKNGESEQNYY